ncbi:hypothetical protein B0H10DRAFT_1155831 [Mycena sp. CBHHK59/15]|nr:hypothetical protein B0H10DRAFT_1155831 [Mycena sp. CBHHK59/15]
MDLSKFAARLDMVAYGLVDAITPNIVQGQNADGDKVLRAELYRLNVYGPGSFFKAHKDALRGETMIGSLVVIFLTVHAGGVLTLEHGGTTWTFDSAAQLGRPSARVRRVLRRRNARRPARAHGAPCHPHIQPLPLGARARTLSTASSPRLNARSRTPCGRCWRTLPPAGSSRTGSRTRCAPPLPPHVNWVNGERIMPASQLSPVLRLLKGSDARIRTISEHVGLVTHVKLLYNSGYYGWITGHDVLADDVLDMWGVNESFDVSDRALI